MPILETATLPALREVRHLGGEEAGGLRQVTGLSNLDYKLRPCRRKQPPTDRPKQANQKACQLATVPSFIINIYVHIKWNTVQLCGKESSECVLFKMRRVLNSLEYTV